METGETCGAWSMPSGGSLCLLGWLLVWPGLLLMSMTIPDCRQPRFRMWFPLTFVAAIVWVGLLSYFSVWMVTVIGLGNMALCNLLGSNVFDILFCLGGPWFVKAAFFSPDQHKVLFSSAGVSFSAAVLLTLVLILYLFLAGFCWKLDLRVGLACLLLYAAYIVIACMYEMNVFGVVNNLLCL
ncbi:probable sodium/potassium/calcium exchanger CG1090 [Rhipicephalus sanguineus]|uniref:probable sodium/potassium/calcium exchanger CG1090 n=1 Tax=Rhipicephalus sanguineus TaxID=34632 RepID=UPI0018947EE7|nr:probable sodium/potassium/calcium exchanger CG1090 [Rhipicephalus sanguineus]